jgi:membrane-associated protein
MPYARFQAYNVGGGLGWVLSLTWAGYFIGNIPIIKDNFGVVTIVIIAVSLLPIAWAALKR